VLIGHGFRVLGSDIYMASRADALDLRTYLPEPDLG
jgi:hypothetical protein